jgi:hypothetical protein
MPTRASRNGVGPHADLNVTLEGDEPQSAATGHEGPWSGGQQKGCVYRRRSSRRPLEALFKSMKLKLHQRASENHEPEGLRLVLHKVRHLYITLS